MPAKDNDPRLDPRKDSDAPGGGDRDQLVSKRRERQLDAANGGEGKRMTIAFLLLAGGLAVFAMVAGPRAALKLLGLTASDGQRTSQVDLKVDKEADDQKQLDFVVPGKPQPAKTEPSREPGLSEAEVQRLLAANNQEMAKRLENERKAMADEVARIRAEAEADKLKAADRAEREKLNQKQRESNAVIVDGGSVSADSATIASNSGQATLADSDPNRRFLKSTASSIVQTSVSQQLRDPSQTVVQGTIISAVLETAIDTQLPGSVRAQVMRPVYSFDGTKILMPSGTILVGEFNNDVEVAQKRVLIAWNRAITPDGKSIALGSIGTDTLGRSGTVGNVDNRYATKFGAAILISAVTAIPDVLANQSGGQSSSSGGTTTVNVSAGNKLGSKVGDAAGEQTKDILGQYLSLPPVIRIPQGEEIRVFVSRDLVFQ